MYSIPFWSKTYRYVSSIRNDNRVKWVQYQIVRNSQFTNYKVNKFNPNVSALCSYCKEAEELVSHLYYRWPVVQNFWKELQIFMANFHLVRIQFYLAIRKNLPILLSMSFFSGQNIISGHSSLRLHTRQLLALKQY